MALLHSSAIAPSASSSSSSASVDHKPFTTNGPVVAAPAAAAPVAPVARHLRPCWWCGRVREWVGSMGKCLWSSWHTPPERSRWVLRSLHYALARRSRRRDLSPSPTFCMFGLLLLLLEPLTKYPNPSHRQKTMRLAGGSRPQRGATLCAAAVVATILLLLLLALATAASGA